MAKSRNFNFTEKDIENWLFENPETIRVMGNERIERWIARQYKLPSGIADLVGLSTEGIVTVVEVKNVPADGKAIAQVCRYAADIQSVLNYRAHYRGHETDNGYGEARVSKIIVAPSVESKVTIMEADACQVGLRSFFAFIDIEIGVFGRNGQAVTEAASFNNSFARDLDGYFRQVMQIARGKEWDSAGPYKDIMDDVFDAAYPPADETDGKDTEP